MFSFPLTAFLVLDEHCSNISEVKFCFNKSSQSLFEVRLCGVGLGERSSSGSSVEKARLMIPVGVFLEFSVIKST